MAQYYFEDCCIPGNIYQIDNITGSFSTGEVSLVYATGLTTSFSGCASVTTSTSSIASLTAVTNTTAYTTCDECQAVNAEPGCCPCLFPTTITLSTGGNFTGSVAQITFSAQTGGTSVNIGNFILPYNYSSCDYIGTYDLYFSAYNKHCYIDVTGLTPCTILYNVNTGGTSNLYIYDFTGNTAQQIQITNFSSITATDIAHTQTKFFANTSATDITEWNLSLSPYSTSYNRIIKMPSGVFLGSGLGCINNTYLISSDTSKTPNELIELNISGLTAITRTITTLSANTQISGDILYTTQGKVIFTTETSISNTRHITQHDYFTGNLEFTIQIGSSTTGITTPFGLFEYNNDIYISDQTSQTIYRIDKTSPYAVTSISNPPNRFNGASQVPCCNTASFS
jgi:hypothetical protein